MKVVFCEDDYFSAELGRELSSLKMGRFFKFFPNFFQQMKRTDIKNPTLQTRGIAGRIKPYERLVTGWPWVSRESHRCIDHLI